MQTNESNITRFGVRFRDLPFEVKENIMSHLDMESFALLIKEVPEGTLDLRMDNYSYYKMIPNSLKLDPRLHVYGVLPGCPYQHTIDYKALWVMGLGLYDECYCDDLNTFSKAKAAFLRPRCGYCQVNVDLRPLSLELGRKPCFKVQPITSLLKTPTEWAYARHRMRELLHYRAYQALLVSAHVSEGLVNGVLAQLGFVAPASHCKHKPVCGLLNFPGEVPELPDMARDDIPENFDAMAPLQPGRRAFINDLFKQETMTTLTVALANVHRQQIKLSLMRYGIPDLKPGYRGFPSECIFRYEILRSELLHRYGPEKGVMRYVELMDTSAFYCPICRRAHRGRSGTGIAALVRHIWELHYDYFWTRSLTPKAML